MNARERVFAALHHEAPDYIPTHIIYLDANNVDELLGKEPVSDFDLIAKLEQDYPDKMEFLENLSTSIEDIEADTFRRVIEAKVKLGIDFGQVGILCMQFINNHELKDIFGRVLEAFNNAGHIWPYYKFGTIKSIAQWENEIKTPIQEIYTKKYTKFVKRFFKTCTRQYQNGDKIFVGVTNDIMGTFESAWQGMGMPFFAAQLRRNPEFIREAFNCYTDFTIEIYKAYMDVGAEVFIESGDLAYKGRPMMAPKQFEDLLQPCYKRLTDVVHSRGKQIILHTDGYVTPLLDFIINSGFDGLQSLEPSAGVNLSEVRQKVGNRLCLLGNIDTGEVLTTGTKEQVFSAVKTAIQQGGPKGFMVSAVNMHPAVKLQNLQWMIEAAHKFNTFS